MQKTFFTVANFISWQKTKSLVLAPKFQRRSVWKVGAKSFLIDTIVRNFPIPIIFLRDKRTDPNTLESMREVIDGQQRLRTVLSYVAPELLPDFVPARDGFTVKKTHNKDLADKKFSDLDPDTKLKILDFQFSVHVLPSDTDDRQVIEIFRRMNSTNYNLSKQELRNALYFGEFKSSAYLLAEEQYHRWTRWNVFDDDAIARMVEVEFTSECMVSMLDGKIGGKSASRIDKAYENFDEKFIMRPELERRFRFVMEQVATHFDSDFADLVFLDKRLIYTFLLFVYDLSIGLSTPMTKRTKGKALKAEQISAIKTASERIKKRTAPENVLVSTDRRTTNPKERGILFNYLKKLAAHA
jgi:hypothetical protein